MTTTTTPYAVRAWVEQIMGLPISVHVRAVDPDRSDISDAVAEVWSLLREVDEVFSTWRNDSDVMQLRRGLLPEPMAHPWIGDIKAMCAYAEAATGGLFVSDLVGPDGTEGWDPTGLVKGWAIDRAADILRTLPAVTFCINAGGDILCGTGTGTTSERLRAPWRIGIQDPRDRYAVRRTIELTEGAIATSGSSARGSHIIDPRTGRPAHACAQATVRGPELVWADVGATVCFIEPDAVLPAGYELVDTAR